MTDFLIQSTLSNLVVASFLAVIAWVVQLRVRSASLANIFWALVLIKLIVPPLFPLEIFEVPSVSSLTIQSFEVSSETTLLPLMDPGIEELNVDLTGGVPAPLASVEYRARIVPIVFALWLVISTMLLLVSAFRIIRFHWLLKANSHVNYDLSTGLSKDMASQLDLRKHTVQCCHDCQHCTVCLVDGRSSGHCGF